MPELPEVETIRRDLQPVLTNKKIANVRVKKPKLIQGSAKVFAAVLAGKKIDQIKRRGKLIIITFKHEEIILLIHLKMTGQLIYVRKNQLIAGGHSWPELESMPNKYSHIIFSLADKSMLYFNDMRQFGYMRLVQPAELAPILARYGVEPLDKGFTDLALRQVIGRRKTALKNVLLNQTLIAGLGNIYVDEACFLAGVKPTRPAHKLTAVEVKKLRRAIIHVLRQALKHRGTTFNNYRDSQGRRGNFAAKLKVYGRAGQLCRRCRKSNIKKTKVGGRGTHFCPACQR